MTEITNLICIPQDILQISKLMLHKSVPTLFEDVLWLRTEISDLVLCATGEQIENFTSKAFDYVTVRFIVLNNNATLKIPSTLLKYTYKTRHVKKCQKEHN